MSSHLIAFTFTVWKENLGAGTLVVLNSEGMFHLNLTIIYPVPQSFMYMCMCVYIYSSTHTHTHFRKQMVLGWILSITKQKWKHTTQAIFIEPSFDNSL